MASRFEFSQDVQSKAHLRQGGKCAHCGVTLVWQYDPAQPVYPVDASNDAASEWRTGPDNCVILCNGCYLWIHDDGDNPSSSPTLADDYVFSHGVSKSGPHREWVVRMMGR